MDYGIAGSKLLHPTDAKVEPKKSSPKKRKEVSVRASKNGKYIITHRHHGAHQDEEHVASNAKELASHMAANLPEPEPEMAMPGAEAMQGPGQV